VLRIDYAGTGLMLDYLEAVAAGGRVSSAELAAIVSDPGYTLLLDRRRLLAAQQGEVQAEAALTPDELVRCLASCAAAAGDSWEGHGFFKSLLRALDRARERLPYHRRVFQAVRRLKPEALEAEVLVRLPRGARIDTTIYFLAETHSDAYVFKGNVVVSFWPLRLAEGGSEDHGSSSDGVLLMGAPVEAVLKHELHHIGLKSVLPEVYAKDDLPESPQELALGLISGLAGEGAATMFFTPYDRFGKGPGSLPWEKTADDLPRHYRDLEEMLADLLGGRLAAAEGLKRAIPRFIGPYEEKNLAAIYVLGVDMCRRIAGVAGTERLVELLPSPAGFFAAYSEAAARSGGHRFPDEMVRMVTEAAHSLEGSR